MSALLPPDPGRLIHEFAHWNLVLNANQDLLGRCFFALKRPETDVAALTNDELLDLWACLRRAKAALDALWSPDHFNFAFLMNEEPQVHFHVIPRYKTRREFAGGTFSDPAWGTHYNTGPARHLDPTGFEAVRTALRGALASTPAPAAGTEQHP